MTVIYRVTAIYRAVIYRFDCIKNLLEARAESVAEDENKLLRISSVGRKKFDCRAGGRLGSIPGGRTNTKGLKKGHTFVLAANG